MPFIGKMSLLLTASYDQLVGGLTAVQTAATRTVRAVGGLGQQATASLSGVTPLLPRIAAGLADIAASAGGAGVAIARLGSSFSDLARKREQAERRGGGSIALPIAGGAAAAVAAGKAMAQTAAANQNALRLIAAAGAAPQPGAQAPPSRQAAARLLGMSRPVAPTPSRFAPPPTLAGIAAAQAQAQAASQGLPLAARGWPTRGGRGGMPLGGWAMLPPSTGTAPAPSSNAADLAAAQEFERQVQEEAQRRVGNTSAMNFGQRMAALRGARQQAQAAVLARLQQHAQIANLMSQAGHQAALDRYNRLRDEAQREMHEAMAARLRATVLPVGAEQIGRGLAQQALARTIGQEAVERGRRLAAGSQGGLSLLLAQAQVPLAESEQQSTGAVAQVAELERLLKKIQGHPKREIAARRRAQELLDRPDLPPEARPAAEQALLNVERAARARRLAGRQALARLGGAPGVLPEDRAQEAWVAGLEAARKQRAAQELAMLQAGGSIGYNGKLVMPGDRNEIGRAAAAGGGGMGAAGYAGLAVGAAALAYAVKVGGDLEQQMARVRGLTGATAEEFARLKNAAVTMGQSTLISATEAARGMQTLASSGFSAARVAELLPVIGRAAVASGVGIETTGKAATTMAHNFGMGTDEIAHFLDVVGYSASRSGHSYEEFMEGVNMSMPVLKAAGMSVEEMSANLMILSQKGLSGSTAGTLMRNLAKKTVDSSNEAQVAMKALGIEAVSPTTGRGLSPAEFAKRFNEATRGMGAGSRLQLAEKIVETRAAPGFLAFANDTKALDQALKDVSLSADDWNKKMEEMQRATLSGQWRLFRGEVEAVAVKLYDFAEGPLKLTLSLFEKIAGVLSGKYGGGLGKILGETVGGAGAGFAGGSLVKLLTMLFPAGAGIRTLGAVAPKAGGIFGGIWGLAKGTFEEVRDFFKAPKSEGAFDKTIEKAKDWHKKSQESAGEGVDVTGVMKLTKALIEMDAAIRDSTAAMRAQAAASVEQFAIQSGGIPVVRQIADAYRAQHQGVKKLADVEKEQADVRGQLAPLEAIKRYQDMIVPLAEQLEELKGSKDQALEFFDDRLGRWGDAGRDDMVDRVKRQRQAFVELAGLEKAIGHAEAMEAMRGHTPRGWFFNDRSLQLAKLKEQAQALRDSKLLEPIGKDRELFGATQAALEAQNIKGKLEALTSTPAAEKDIVELKARLKELSIGDDGLLAIGLRMRELNEAATASGPAMQRMVVQREAMRAAAVHELQSYKDLAKAREQLRAAERMGESPDILKNLRGMILGKEGKDGGDIGLEKKFQIEAQSAVYRKHAEQINRTLADVERPEEAFGRQTAGLMSQLLIPTDVQAQVYRAQSALTRAQKAAAAPGSGKEAADSLLDARHNLDQLMFDVEHGTLSWDTFERAVRKAGKAMDDALGGSRLPPALLEGSAAAVSRINQYEAETDPNRAVLGDIYEVLVAGRELQRRNNELLRELRDKTGEPGAAPAPAQPLLGPKRAPR